MLIHIGAEDNNGSSAAQPDNLERHNSNGAGTLDHDQISGLHLGLFDKIEVIATKPPHLWDEVRPLIVTDKLLTGYDAPLLYCLYLDKPMQGHTLMQAIARVNRVYRDKESGWVVDYNGMVRSLRRALATFASRPEDDNPARQVDPLEDERAALADYAASVQAARGHIEGLGFDLALLTGSQRLDKLEPLAFAVGCAKRNDESRITFNVLVEAMQAKFRALFPHPDLALHYDEHDALCAVYNKLNERKEVDSISAMLRELHDVVGEPVHRADITGAGHPPRPRSVTSLAGSVTIRHPV